MFSQDMADGIIFGNNIGIWDSCKSEKLKIRIGTRKDSFLIPIYVTSREETCIVVLIEGVFDTFGEHKLFSPTLTARYFGSIVGMEVF
jgi:hypothetical protein